MKNSHRRLIPAMMAALMVASPLWADPIVLNRDIESYVLFALDSLAFKGRNANDARGFILGGNIGVNRSEPNTNDFLLNLGGASAAVIVSDGVQVAADSMALSTLFQSQSTNPGQVDLFSNRTGQLPAATNYASLQTFTDPILVAPSLPFDPSDNTSTENVTVESGATRNLDPGSYQDVWVKDGGTLNLSGGTYYLRNLRGGKQPIINVTDGTILYISGYFDMNEEPFFGVGSTGGAKIYVASVKDDFNDLGANNASIHFGRGGCQNIAQVYGQFYAPNGIMNLGNCTDLYGKYWAQSIASDFNVNVTYRTSTPIPEPTTLILLGSGVAAIATYRRKRLQT